MLRNTLALGVALTALATPMLAADAASLEVGVKAPNLSDVNWLKGDAIPQWEAGKVYVLDFWATWCGPCKASIPHINELQAEYKDKGVTVIGVAIWPNDRMVPTNEFVEAKGDAMAYHIAEDIDGKTADAFMKAAGQNGIPTVMVIDKTGTLAWMGHPMGGLDDVLPEVVAGTFDAKSFAEKQRVHDEKVEALMDDLQSGFSASDWARVQTASENLIAFDTDEFGTLGAVYKYMALVKQDKGADAAAWGAEVTNTYLGKNADDLNRFAWMIVQPDGPLEADEIDAKLAIAACEKAATLQKDDANILDTLARAYFVDGQYTKAVETEQKALDNVKNDPAMQEALQEALDTYKAKAGQS